ncbi:MAG: hypothetical protein M1833_002449, partial [Piccolia ochrophora]
ILAYTAVSPAEEASWGSIPVTLNLSTGLFVTPARKGVLKVARHAYGYVNPQTIAYPEPGPPSASTTFRISVPATHHPIPTAASSLLHAFQTSLFPSLSTRPFTYTRLCWYADTPTGDFLIDRHPRYAGLLLATGGSGHGFKFLPVIGEKVVEVLEGRVGDELGGRWRWREREGEREGEDGWGTEDGSRSGERGVVLESALRQGVQERGKL